MTAQIISMDAARKARQKARDDRAAIFLLPVHVAAFWTETWLDALRRVERDLPRWPGGIDDLEI